MLFQCALKEALFAEEDLKIKINFMKKSFAEQIQSKKAI